MVKSKKLLDIAFAYIKCH